MAKFKSSKSKVQSSESSNQKSLISASEIFIRIIFAISILSASTFLYLKYHEKLGFKLPKLTAPVDRLLYTFKLLLFSLFPLVGCLQYVMLTRLANPAARNPLSGNEHHVEKGVRVLSNTVEQLILHFVNLLIFSLNISPNYLCLIPFLIGLFVFGRLTFAIGYAIHPRYREFGFVFTYAPTMGVFVFNLLKTVEIV